MVMNMAARRASKYGVPFAMILRGSLKIRGAILLDCARESRQYVVRLAVLRGIAGISYFDWEDLADF